MKTIHEIAAILVERRLSRSPLIEKMMQVRERYNGDWVLPDLGEAMGPMTPAIIADAIDHTGLRAASTAPQIVCPALEAGKETGRRSLEWADKRRRALSYTWYRSELNLSLRRAYRHLPGYATTCLVVIPDFKLECPRIIIRDPLHAFPQPRAAEDVEPPEDCGFVYGKSASWISRRYPAVADMVHGSAHAGRLWDMVEWIDEDDIVVGLLGPRWDVDGSGATSGWLSTGQVRPIELSRYPNRAGRCTVVIPERVTLDRVASAVGQIVGNVDLQAKLLALDVMATERALFPDKYILGTSAMIPRLIGGQWKDGRTGEVNVIVDASAVGELRSTPDPSTKIAQDRLERNARVSTGLVPQFGGESYGALRTGRGIDAIMSAAVDPRIQEFQEVMAHRLTDANRIVFDMYEGYWNQKRYHVFSGWRTDQALVEFEPEKHFETHENAVRYPFPGTDLNAMTIALGQLVGAEFMSRDSGRAIHPFIEDPEGEQRKVQGEKLLQAIEQMVLMRASDPTGGLTPIDIAYMYDAVMAGRSLAEAVTEADRRARERQAREAPPPEPGMVAAPEAMPGIAAPGEGAESPLPSTINTPPGVGDLDQLLNALRQPGVGV